MENNNSNKKTRQIPATNNDWTSPSDWSVTNYFMQCEEHHMRASTALNGRRIA